MKKDIHSVNLTESEASLRRHGELEAELAVEPDMQVFGNCLVISIGENSSAPFVPVAVGRVLIEINFYQFWLLCLLDK